MSFRSGFIVTLGALTAIALGTAIVSLSYALTLIFVAFFISLGLDPTVRWLERLGMSRTIAVLCVLGTVLAFAIVVVVFLLPQVVVEAYQLLLRIPAGFDGIENQEWFISLDETFNGAMTNALAWLEHAVADPNVWLAVGNGALRVGFGVASAVFGVLFVTVLTMYFVTSLSSIKQGFYLLVPASRRERVVGLAETIFASVGQYVSGMAILAAINAAFSFALLSVMGVRYALVVSVLALAITMIPLVGSVISTAIMTLVSLLTSPSTALVVLLVMLVYMQVEAYVLTPRVVGKAIQIPASLVLIGAMVGGTLLGLLGALVACPTTAAILLILKKVVIPRQAVR
ncbi:AI-2E family transporter [Arthrobacter ginkgonis]|uniref:AI-2E family transporter n=1 Tax=Arthrobacter ginkgonis TaxID=1630594 RepID=A0ABP7D3E5_9MICC